MDRRQAAPLVQALGGQQQRERAAGPGQILGREAVLGQAFQQGFAMTGGRLGQHGLQGSAGFLALVGALQEGELILQQTEAPGEAARHAPPLRGRGFQALRALQERGASGFGLQAHAAFRQGTNAGIQRGPDGIRIRDPSLACEEVGPGHLLLDAILLGGRQGGTAGHQAILEAHDLIGAPAAAGQAAAPAFRPIDEFHHRGLRGHLPRLLQEQVADALDGVVFLGPLGDLLILPLGAAHGVDGQVHAVDPGVGVPVKTRGRGLDARQRVVTRQRPLIFSYARLQGLDARLDEAVHPVPGQQLRQPP